MNNMSVLSLVVAALLIALGVGGYIASGMASVTALIPAFLGFPIARFVACWLARKPCANMLCTSLC